VLVAVTVNVYAVPSVSPVTVQLNGPDDHEHACPPGDAVTVKREIPEPPLLTGADHDTTTCAFPATHDTLVGAPGTEIETPPDPSDTAASTSTPTSPGATRTLTRDPPTLGHPHYGTGTTRTLTRDPTPEPGRHTHRTAVGCATNELLCERCAQRSSPDRGTVRREVAGQEDESRDGDSNPGPAHYEQFQAERCAHQRDR
jgi:hypothetical protein